MANEIEIDFAVDDREYKKSIKFMSKSLIGAAKNAEKLKKKLNKGIVNGLKKAAASFKKLGAAGKAAFGKIKANSGNLLKGIAIGFVAITAAAAASFAIFIKLGKLAGGRQGLRNLLPNKEEVKNFEDLRRELTGKGILSSEFFDVASNTLLRTTRSAKATREALLILSDAKYDLNLSDAEVAGLADKMAKLTVKFRAGQLAVADLKAIDEKFKTGLAATFKDVEKFTPQQVWEELAKQVSDLPAGILGVQEAQKDFDSQITAFFNKIENFQVDFFEKLFGGSQDASKNLAKLNDQFDGFIDSLIGGLDSAITFFQENQDAIIIVASIIGGVLLAALTVVTVAAAAAAIAMLGITAAAAVWVAAGAVIAGVIALIIVKWNDMIEIFDFFAGAAKDFGTQIIDGLIDGITGGLSKLTATMLGVKDTVVGSLKSFLKISSPSKEMEELGKFTAEGFNKGLANTQIANANEKILNDVKNRVLSNSMNQATGASSGSSLGGDSATSRLDSALQSSGNKSSSSSTSVSAPIKFEINVAADSGLTEAGLRQAFSDVQPQIYDFLSRNALKAAGQ